jgi:hypothetical protein
MTRSFLENRVMTPNTKRTEVHAGGLLRIGPNQMSLLRALFHTPGNCFPSLRVWYTYPEVVGGSGESRRQGCWRVIRRGWVAAYNAGGRWECTLTQTGRDIAEGKTNVRIVRC